MCFFIRLPLAACAVIAALLVSTVSAQEIQIAKTAPDPYGCPRPYINEANVPTQTSYYIVLGLKDKDPNDRIIADSIIIKLKAADTNTITTILEAGKKFAKGYSGKISQNSFTPGHVEMNIDSAVELKPSTKYTVTVSARSSKGSELKFPANFWQFTTEPKTAIHRVSLDADLSSLVVQWHGGFFNGLLTTTFGTTSANRIPSYDLVDSIRKKYPKCLDFIRHLWPTGFENAPTDGLLKWELPNVMRERETRRIIAVEKQSEGTLLKVEDFFGHQQYGIESNRPLKGDYNEGDEVLISDGFTHEKAKVIKIVDDAGPARTLLVSSFKDPAGGWKIAYTAPLPTKEDPNAPGLFPRGGCYLRKLSPSGTICYYWGRLDKEYDLHHLRYGRRLVVNFCDAGDLTDTPRTYNGTYTATGLPKDYAQYHQLVRDMTTHLIDRYGVAACKNFYWSVFNEPDLGGYLYSSDNWKPMVMFYDYTVDAVCRAFEDKGYDSNNLMVGGIEMGGIWGAHVAEPAFRRILTHCSPTATAKDVPLQNFAYTDKRLDGKRSRRLENICRPTGGKGGICDFISVHTYNSSQKVAEKIAASKKIALDIDPNRYANLWVNSFESAPNWLPPPDDAAADSYMGNGYWTAWSADTIRNQLAYGAKDPRYCFGESVLTIWPFPNRNFEINMDNETRVIAVDDNGDGIKDREVAIAEPILNFLALISDMGNNYILLPEQKVANQTISGFVSKKADALNVLVYAHNPLDTQSRSNQAFDISLTLKNVPWKKVNVKEYRFDKENNTYFRLASQLKQEKVKQLSDPAKIRDLVDRVKSSDPKAQIAAIKQLSSMEVPLEAWSEVMDFMNNEKNPEVKAAFNSAGQKSLTSGQTVFKAKDIAKIQEQSTMHKTKQYTGKPDKDGGLKLNLEISANGADFVIIEPAGK